MKRLGSKCAIECHPRFGPHFGDFDIVLEDNLDEDSNCWISNDGTGGYECHPQYKKSLFVNSAKSNERNDFTLQDFEVYGIDFEKQHNINQLCKYPNIIWNYIETKNISDESLKQFDDDIELLNDLDAIHCDNAIRLKISNYYLKNPSELLPNTQLVSQQYDDNLREWAGDYKWKLLYRASEHDYTSKSFHEYCDKVKGPTLVIIKSSGGWIFGGYTTQSWSGRCIYNDMI